MTFLGNTTILLCDGTTRLMVDGFLSRPGAMRTLLGTIESDESVVKVELARAGVTKLDAILVSHAHHDHSLDAPLVARLTGATVVGSKSYGRVHAGSDGPDRLITVTRDRETHRFGKFRVTFVASEHVPSFSFLQRAVEGSIHEPVHPPARFTEYKCGKVYALHIEHPEGNVAVTTTVGAEADQYAGLKADVLFLGVGLLSKDSEENRERYWNETVGTLDPDVVVPVHWDNFSRKLSRGLVPFPRIADDVEKTFQWLGSQSSDRKLIVMDLREKIRLKNGSID